MKMRTRLGPGVDSGFDPDCLHHTHYVAHGAGCVFVTALLMLMGVAYLILMLLRAISS